MIFSLNERFAIKFKKKIADLKYERVKTFRMPIVNPVPTYRQICDLWLCKCNVLVNFHVCLEAQSVKWRTTGTTYQIISYVHVFRRCTFLGACHSPGQVSHLWCSLNIPSISPEPSHIFKQSFCVAPHLYVKPLLFDFSVISGTVLIFIGDVCLFKTGYCVNWSIGFKWIRKSDRPKHRLEWRVEWTTVAQGSKLSHAGFLTSESSTHDPTCVYTFTSFSCGFTDKCHCVY